MNTFLRKKGFRKKLRIPKPLSLQSALSILIAIILYTALSTWFFSPAIQVVDEKDGSLLFVATDTNDPMRASIAASIDAAKSSVLLVTYTLTDKKIISSLKQASERNVPVTVIFDSIASPETPFLLGKHITSYGRRRRGLMHQKLLVIDKSIVWLGSANMTPSSFLQYGNIMTCIRSRSLAETIISYGETLRSKTACTNTPLQLLFPEQKLTFFIHPAQAKESLSHLIKKIETAKNRIFIAMYTFTHEAIVRALGQAHKRGVSVKIIFDKDSILQTSKAAYVRCKREGIICGFRKKSGLLHYKTAIIDDCLILGSANWTKAAFQYNDDCLLCIEPLSSAQETWVQAWWNEVEKTAR